MYRFNLTDTISAVIILVQEGYDVIIQEGYMIYEIATCNSILEVMEVLVEILSRDWSKTNYRSWSDY